MVGIADWLIHREMGCDWLVANMKRFEKIRIYFNGKSTHIICIQLPWIPEPSTVNNKLKCREGSGSTGRFFLARFNQRISPLNQSLHDISIYYLLSKALESRVAYSVIF